MEYILKCILLLSTGFKVSQARNQQGVSGEQGIPSSPYWFLLAYSLEP
jgi:hypothetical protein